MNTEEYILIENTDINMERIKVPKFSDEELYTIQQFIEFTRHIQEIDQLFHIFKINLREILLNYELNCDDTIVRKIDLSYDEEDMIIINTLVINYISSAKTFVESIETFINKNMAEEDVKKFKVDCLSKIYDEKFSYRLLIRLRDYAQHGHLPVYMSYNKKCSFDLDQILFTPNFSHNKKIQNEMIELRQKIYNEFGDNPRIMFTMSIAEFQLCILKIYIYFIDLIKEKLVDLVNKMDTLIKERPDVIYKSEDSLNGFIVYSIENKFVQCLNPKEKPLKMIDKIKSDVENEFQNAKKEFEKLFKTEENQFECKHIKCNKNKLR